MNAKKEDTTYNGWANWETWNVALWFDNDERLYNRVLVHYGKHGKFNAQAAKTFVQLELPRGTPDFKDEAARTKTPIERYTHEALERVDWASIAEHFNTIETG